MDMAAIIDSRSDSYAIERLRQLCGNVLEFDSQSVTYDSISGHPDIFIFQDYEKLIVAPNAPEKLFVFLNSLAIDFQKGHAPVGETLENSTLYNCLCTKKYFFHKKNHTDISISEHVNDKIFINLPQAYTACSLIAVDDTHFITSDRGIEKMLTKSGFECCFFNPEEIRIHGHKHGFIGGTVGISGKTIFFNGNPERHQDGKKILKFIADCSFDTIFLSDTYLYDGGRIFFIR